MKVNNKYQPTTNKPSVSTGDALLKIARWSLGTFIIVGVVIPIARDAIESKGGFQPQTVSPSAIVNSPRTREDFNREIAIKCNEMNVGVSGLRDNGATSSYARESVGQTTIDSCQSVGVDVDVKPATLQQTFRARTYTDSEGNVALTEFGCLNAQTVSGGNTDRLVNECGKYGITLRHSSDDSLTDSVQDNGLSLKRMPLVALPGQ